MKNYKLTFENNRTCTIECEETGQPLQDKINAAEQRFNSPVVKINDKQVKEHSLGGFLLGAVIGSVLGNSVAKSGVKKTASKIGSRTKKAVGKAKKDISEFRKASTKKYSNGGKTDKYGFHIEPQFKEGDLVTYNGFDGEIIKVGKDSRGRYYYDVLFAKQGLRVVANYIYNKGNEIKLKNKKYSDGGVLSNNEIADNMEQNELMVTFAKEVRNYPTQVDRNVLENILPDYISGKDITYILTKQPKFNVIPKDSVEYPNKKVLRSETAPDGRLIEVISFQPIKDKPNELTYGVLENGNYRGGYENQYYANNTAFRLLNSSNITESDDPYYENGGIIKFNDGFSFKKVSKEYAEKNFQNENIFGINVSQETESLIESKEDLDDFEVFGIEIGFQDKFAEGGLVGKHAIFDRFGEQKMGIITEDLGDGRLIVISGMGQYAVTPDNLISITEPVEKKGFFSFGKGGGVYNRSWHQDHNRHNKDESYEKPMSERSKKFGEGGGLPKKRYKYLVLAELYNLYHKGYSTVQLNGFSESIGYVIGLQLDDTEIKKVGERAYITLYSKGGSTEYNRSWHQDHNRHNKDESYEKPMSERSKKFSEGGGVKILYSGSELNRRFELSKQEILADVKSGKVPKSVNSFSELQNYVDANCYGGLCDNDYKISKDYSFENKLQLKLNHWIEQGGIKGSSKYSNGGKITKQPDGTYTHPSGYVIEPAYDKGRYILLDPDGMDAVGESMTLKEAKETLLDNVETYEFGNGGYLVQYGPGNKQTIISTKSEADDFVKTLKEKGHTNIKVRSKSEYKKQYESTSEDIKMDLQKRFNINPNSYALILSEKGKWKISPVNIKDWMNNYGSIQTVEQEINKQYKKFSGGGGVEMPRYAVYWLEDDSLQREHFNEDELDIAEEVYQQYKDTLYYYQKGKVNITDLKTNKIIKGNDFEYSNGGGVPSIKKYRLLSPDGFDIEMDALYSEQELMPAFEQFKKRYEKQGYYSTANRERIDLRDLEDYMTVVEVENYEDYE